MKITIRNFQKKIPISPKRTKETVLKVLSGQKSGKSGSISISFVTDATIKRLNKKFLKQNTPTDVLAFELSAKPAKLEADIIISADTAIRNAKEFKSSPQQELKLYVIHGLLHLLGYEDRTGKERLEMRKKESKYVNS